MKRLFSIPVLFLVLTDCIKINHKVVQDTIQPKGTIIQRTKPPSTFRNMVIVDQACALFYQPDSLQKEKIRAITEPRIFYATMHDFFFMQTNAHRFLKQHMKNLKIIDMKNTRVLFFIKKNAAFEVVDLDKLGDSYGLILFDRIKDPLQVDMSNVETQVESYFRTP